MGITVDRHPTLPQAMCQSVLFPKTGLAITVYPVLRGWKATQIAFRRQACSPRKSGWGVNDSGSSFSIRRTSDGL